MDLYPTLADLTGMKKPSHLDGRSLLPQIMNPETNTSPVVTSYKFDWAETPVIGHAVRSMHFRYIYYPEINLEELYDHRSDPKEWDNIAYKKQNKSIIREHRKTLLELLPDHKWKGGSPDGYTIDSDGNVRKDNFISTF